MLRTNTYVNRLRTALALQQPTGAWTNGFIYDAAARLTNVTSQAGSFGYFLGAKGPASPLIRSNTLPNTSFITNAYDSMGRMLATKLLTSASVILDAVEYGYNCANERTAYTNAAGTYVLCSCDNISQIKVATSSVSSENRGYFYDAAWNLNRRTNNGVSSTFTVDNKNQLTNAAGSAVHLRSRPPSALDAAVKVNQRLGAPAYSHRITLTAVPIESVVSGATST